MKDKLQRGSVNFSRLLMTLNAAFPSTDTSVSPPPTAHIPQGNLECLWSFSVEQQSLFPAGGCRGAQLHLEMPTRIQIETRYRRKHFHTDFTLILLANQCVATRGQSGAEAEKQTDMALTLYHLMKLIWLTFQTQTVGYLYIQHTQSSNSVPLELCFKPPDKFKTNNSQPVS